MKHRGSNIVEMMMIVAIIGVIAALLFGPSRGEERCIAGYKFVVGVRGQPQQVMDQWGQGIACEVHHQPSDFK